MKKLLYFLLLPFFLTSCLDNSQGTITKVHISPTSTENIYGVSVEITQAGPNGKTLLNSKFKCLAGEVNKLRTYTGIDKTSVRIDVTIPKERRSKDKITVYVSVEKGSQKVSASEWVFDPNTLDNFLATHEPNSPNLIK